jgi:hypothetical protein
MRKRNVSWVRGAAVGFVGGIAASYAMTLFQKLVYKLEGTPDPEKSRTRKESESKSGNEPATVKAAEQVSSKVLHHSLSRREKRWAGPAMHYAFGGAVGILYGILGELFPRATLGYGKGYGTAVWLLADETGVPLLNLSKRPDRFSLSAHAYALGGHLVYGLVLESVRDLGTRSTVFRKAA